MERRAGRLDLAFDFAQAVAGDGFASLLGVELTHSAPGHIQAEPLAGYELIAFWKAGRASTRST